MKQFLFFANSATDAAMIATDNISDIEITAASGSAKVSINYTTNVGNGDGSILLDTSDSPAAVREITRMMLTSREPFITVADDVNGSYVKGVTACGTITHS